MTLTNSFLNMSRLTKREIAIMVIGVVLLYLSNFHNRNCLPVSHQQFHIYRSRKSKQETENGSLRPVVQESNYIIRSVFDVDESVDGIPDNETSILDVTDAYYAADTADGAKSSLDRPPPAKRYIRLKQRTHGNVRYYYVKKFLGNLDVQPKPGSLYPELEPEDYDGNIIKYDQESVDEDGVPLYYMNTWNPRHPSSKSSNPEIEEGRLRLRKLIKMNQHPEDCRKVKFCSCWHSKGLGLFSVLHGRAFCLLGAMIKGCTLVGSRDGSLQDYINKKACWNYGVKWDCYFKPITSCPWSAINRHKVTPLPLNLFEQKCSVSRNSMKHLLNMVGLKSELVAQSELVSWVMRPNDRLKESISLWARYLNISKEDQIQQTMSAHIRHGDKYSVSWEEKKHTDFTAFILSFKQVYGLSRVHIMSDNVNIGHQLSQMHKFMPVFGLPREAYPGMNLLAEHPEGEMRDLLHHSKIAEKSKGDEALSLFTEAILMSRSPVFLGATTSNIAQVIVELMATVSFPPVYHDRYGDVYSFCWFGETHMDFKKLARGFRARFPVSKNLNDNPLHVPLNETRLACLRNRTCNMANDTVNN